jgi:hypothetical protein
MVVNSVSNLNTTSAPSQVLGSAKDRTKSIEGETCFTAEKQDRPRAGESAKKAFAIQNIQAHIGPFLTEGEMHKLKTVVLSTSPSAELEQKIEKIKKAGGELKNVDTQRNASVESFTKQGVLRVLGNVDGESFLSYLKPSDSRKQVDVSIVSCTKRRGGIVSTIVLHGVDVKDEALKKLSRALSDTTVPFELNRRNSDGSEDAIDTVQHHYKLEAKKNSEDVCRVIVSLEVLAGPGLADYQEEQRSMERLAQLEQIDRFGILILCLGLLAVGVIA